MEFKVKIGITIDFKKICKNLIVKFVNIVFLSNFFPLFLNFFGQIFCCL